MEATQNTLSSHEYSELQFYWSSGLVLWQLHYMELLSCLLLFGVLLCSGGVCTKNLIFISSYLYLFL